MNKLLENSSRQYEYLDNGQKPVDLLVDEDMFTAGIDEDQAPKDKGIYLLNTFIISLF